MLHVEVWGGAREHGRSCYYIRSEQHSVLLDCGGKKENGGVYPLLDKEKIATLDAVFLSHAHEDHSAAIPLLYRYGYEGDIWTTKETARQLPALFQAWAQYVEEANGQLPYDTKDVERITYRLIDEETKPCEWTDIIPEIQVRWGASGHLPGAIWLQLVMDEQRIFFTGDYCAEPPLLKLDPPLTADKHFTLALIDAAYGITIQSQQQLIQQIIETTKNILSRGGHALFPVPLYGRSQDLLFLLAKALPSTPIAVEENIFVAAKQSKHQHAWRRDEANASLQDTFTANRLHVVASDDDRQQLVKSATPHIIFTTDGMATTKHAHWYIQQLAGDRRNAVIFTGQLPQNDCTIECETYKLRYKIHQDLQDVEQMLTQLNTDSILLVHANPAQTDELYEALHTKGVIGLLDMREQRIFSIP